MPEGAYEKFFIELDDAYKVKDSIRNMVDFRYINLLDNDVADQIGKVDIIICKNVLIYFDNNTIKKVINTFYDILKMGGYLFLGHAETITGMNSGFEAIYTPSIFYYKKGGKNL